MLDAEGHIQYRKLNTALLKKYKNPFRILYLWTVQETLEVQAIQESIKLKEELDEMKVDGDYYQESCKFIGKIMKNGWKIIFWGSWNSKN